MTRVRNIFGPETRADRDGRWLVWNHRLGEAVGTFPTETEAKAEAKRLNADWRRKVLGGAA